MPGKKTCHAGWTMEYTGVLMAEAYNHGTSTYVCVDKDPEAIAGTFTVNIRIESKIIIITVSSWLWE